MEKKVLRWLLVATLVVFVLIGCGSKREGDDKKNDSKSSTSEINNSVESENNTENKTENKTEEGQASVEKEVISLRLIQFGTMSERMEDFFEKEFHNKVLEDLKIDLTVEFLPWWSQSTLTTMMAGGESFAFMNIPSGFPNIHLDGYLAKIDPKRVAEIAPNYINARYGMGFDCVTMDGGCWALPVGSKVMASDNYNISIRNDLLKEVGMDYSQIKSVDALMDACAKVREKHPEIWIWPCVNKTLNMIPTQFLAENTLFNSDLLSFVQVNQLDDTDKVISWFESDEFKEVCKFNQELYAKGYSSKDILTDSPFANAQWIAGNALLYVGYPEKIINHPLTNVEGSEQQFLKIGNLPNPKAKDFDWAFSFAAGEEEHLDRWYEFFDWMYASKDNYLFSIYGVENQDWKYGSKGEIVPAKADYMFPYWAVGSMHYDDYADKDSSDIEVYKAMEKNVVMNKDLGFSFNKTPEGGKNYDAMLSALTTLANEKVLPIAYGFGDYDSEWPLVLADLKKAGLDEYIAEYQRQFTEWNKNK